VTGKPAHSSQIFHDDIGFGAALEIARILDGWRAALSAIPNLTFNPGLVMAGTDIDHDPENTRGTFFGKGNDALLAAYSTISEELGYGPVTAVDPRRAGAADISSAADRVVAAMGGFGLMGAGGHTVDEVADLRTVPQNTERIELLVLDQIHRDVMIGLDCRIGLGHLDSYTLGQGTVGLDHPLAHLVDAPIDPHQQFVAVSHEDALPGSGLMNSGLANADVTKVAVAEFADIVFVVARDVHDLGRAPGYLQYYKQHPGM